MNKALFEKDITRIAAVSLLILGITVFHYRMDHLRISSHVLFRELYFVPILLAGFWYGIKGGLTASLTITFFYLPYVLSLPEGITGHNFGNLSQIFLFNLLGLLVGLLRDRERKQQEQMLEAESLAAMGRAVSCIAHDMKTPLIAIGGFAGQVRRKTNEDVSQKKMDLIIDQVKRLELLVSDMLAFARPLQLQCTNGAIVDLIDDVMVVAREKAALHEVVIRAELQQGMPSIAFDPHRLQQALLNLVNNAIEASPRGGEVQIRCSCDSAQIVIEVIDQGEGIPQEHQEHIFTPFITTKKGGTGLGLPIVKKVIEAHAGSIGLNVEIGTGTIFHIKLPCSDS